MTVSKKISRSKSPRRPKTPVKSKPQQSGGSSTISMKEDNIEVSTSTVFAILALGILAIIIYLAYTRSQDEIIKTLISQNVTPTPNSSSPNNTTDAKLQHNLKEKMAPVPGEMQDLNGLRLVGEDANNYNNSSFWGYLTAKNYDRIVNPLLPPERSYENTYGIPVNIPSRGFSGGFQQVGYLYKTEVANPDTPVGNNGKSVILPVYGRPVWPGANKWNYYITSDKFNAVKMPFTYKGKSTDDDHGVDELYDKDVIDLPEYNGKFEVNIYNYDKPRYIPYVY